MKGKFQRIYPDRERIAFDGGLNNRFNRAIIEDNESPDCQNVQFTDRSVETREGVSGLNTQAIGSFPGDGLFVRHDSNGTETMVAFAGGSAYYLSGTTFVTIPSAQGLYNQGSFVAACEYQDYLFVGASGVTPYKYNGVEYTRHGVYPPSMTGSFLTGAGGAPNGAYQYKFVYVNSGVVESDVSTASTTFVVVSSIVNITSIPVAPQSFGVNSRRIYRTVAGGTTFKRVAEIADNTTTTYLDNIADGSLGANAPTDQGVPPNYSVVEYHKDRLFMNDVQNPNFVWYSELANPYVIKATNFIRIGDASGDLVRAIRAFENSVYVYADRTEYLIYMPDTDDTNWVPTKIQSRFGTKSPFGVFNYASGQMFPALENDKFVGFITLNGAAIAPSTTFLTVQNIASEIATEKIEPDMFDIKESLINQITAIVFKRKAYISVPFGSTSSINNRIYVFDFTLNSLLNKTRNSWVPWTGSKLSANHFVSYLGNLYFISSISNGLVYKMNNGTYSDDGSAIDSYYWTKEYGGLDDEYNIVKDFRFVNILLEQSGDWNMDLNYRVDSDDSEGSQVEVDLSAGGSIWGTMIWGTDSWGRSGSEDEKVISLGQSLGKRVQFKFSNQNVVNQKFRVIGLNIQYNVKGVR